MAAKRYVIIGDGAAGTTAAQYLRAADREATIAILSDDPHAAYFRAALTNYLLGALRSEQIFAVPPSFYEELRIHRALARVSQIDPDKSQVCLAQGARIPYDSLLIATGSRARSPIFEGWWHPGIMTMRTLQDVNRVIDLVKQRALRSAVLVGGGPLALEWAHGLSHRGVRVTMVVRESRFLPNAIDSVASDLLLARLRRGGVDVRMGDEVAAALAGHDGRVAGVALKSGHRVDCQLLAVAIGVVCNSEFLAKSGVNINLKNGGIEVDATMRTNLPNIYAAGDVASFEGKVLQLWEPARVQGRIAAGNMSGVRPQKYSPGVHYMATRLYDLDCASMGEIAGPPDGGVGEELVDYPQGTGRISYRKLTIARDGRLIGALMFGEREAQVRRLGRAFKRLIDSKLDVRPVRDDLLDPAFDLPAWLNKNALVDKPEEPEGMAPNLLQSVRQLRVGRPMALSDLPPLPAGEPSNLARGELFDFAAASGPPPIVSVDGGSRGRVKVDGSAVIGRDPHSTIFIEADRQVSATHAEISIAANAVYLRDLGSSNGTWVAGQAVTTPKRLKDGDKIRVGITELTVHIEGGAAASAGPAAAPVVVGGISASPWAGELAPHLEVRSGRAIGLSFELVYSPTTIGRDAWSILRLDDEWIDETHAWVRKGPAGWEIADAASRGVTKRNGVTLEPNVWVPMAMGDIIEVGFVQLAYVMKQASLPMQLGAEAGLGFRISGLPDQAVQSIANVPPSNPIRPIDAPINQGARAPTPPPISPIAVSAPLPEPPKQRVSNRPPSHNRNVNAFGMPALAPSEEVAPATQVDPQVGQVQVGQRVSERPPAKDRHVSEMPAFMFPSAVAPDVVRARLTIRRGPGQGGAATLEQTNVVGNDASECSLVVNDPRIAARHIEIARRPDGFWARDLGSEAGTTRHGQRLSSTEPIKLTHGDVLILASAIELLYEEGGRS